MITDIPYIVYIFQADLRTLHQNPTTFNLSTLHSLYMRLTRLNYVQYTVSKESYVFVRRLYFRKCWKVDAVFITGLGFSFKGNEDVTTNGEGRSCHFRVLSHQSVKVSHKGRYLAPPPERTAYFVTTAHYIPSY